VAAFTWSLVRVANVTVAPVASPGAIASVLSEPSTSAAPSTAPAAVTVAVAVGLGTLVTEIAWVETLPSVPVTLASSASGPAG